MAISALTVPNRSLDFHSIQIHFPNSANGITIHLFSQALESSFTQFFSSSFIINPFSKSCWLQLQGISESGAFLTTTTHHPHSLLSLCFHSCPSTVSMKHAGCLLKCRSVCVIPDNIKCRFYHDSLYLDSESPIALRAVSFFLSFFFFFLVCVYLSCWSINSVWLNST